MKKSANHSLFWGIILILLGILFTLNTFWDISIPVFRIVFSLFLIGLGLVLILGRFGFRRGDNSTIFSESRISYNPSEKSYGCIFGKLDLDLTTIDPNSNNEIEIFCNFGEVNVNISKDAGFMLETSTVFGETKIPEKEYNFGTGKYQSSNYSPDQPYLLLKTRVVFGTLRVHLV
jgi:predicted membrane protein